MKKMILIIIIIVLSITCTFGKIDKVFIIPFSHLDIGFTDTQEEVSKEYAEMVDNLIEIMDTFPDFSFTIETFWQLQQWLETSPEPWKVQKLVQYIKEGRLEIGGAYDSMHTGFMNYLSLSETFKDSKKFAEKNNFTITTAIMNDVPGYTQDLPDILFENNISYFMTGINDKYAQVLQLPAPVNIFYWQGPNGKKILTWVTKASYMEGVNFKSISSIESYAKKLEDEGYPYDAVAILLAKDNGGIEPGLVSYLNLHEASKFSELEIVFSTPTAFFEYMEERYQSVIPTYKGDWSGFWESVKSGGPFSSSLIRWSQEILQEIVSLDLINQNNPLYDIAIKNILLYSEHTAAPGAGWPGNYTLEQNYIFNKTVVDYAFTAYNTVLNIINELTPKEPESNKIYVFNPGNSEKETLLRFELGEWDPNSRVVIKLKGEEYVAYPYSLDSINPWEQVAQGYEVYVKLPIGISEINIINRIPTTYETKKTESSIIENNFYTIKLNSDGSFNVFDKELNTCVVNNGGIIEYSFTNSIQKHEREELVIDSVKTIKYPQKSVMIAEFTDSPITKLEIILPKNEKNFLFNYYFDINKIPYVPYDKHSINFYLKIPITQEGTFSYNGPASLVKDPYEFPALRPEQVSVRDLVAVETKDYTVTLGSRQAFLFGYNEKSGYIDCLLLRHYDEAATKDLGITSLGEVEPGSPNILKYSFFFYTGDKIDEFGVENFYKPPIILK